VAVVVAAAAVVVVAAVAAAAAVSVVVVVVVVVVVMRLLCCSGDAFGGGGVCGKILRLLDPAIRHHDLLTRAYKGLVDSLFAWKCPGTQMYALTLTWSVVSYEPHELRQYRGSPFKDQRLFVRTCSIANF
jgi:hypothetical protein